jgi:phenylalanyl-tRNA synthetase beta subunit
MNISINVDVLVKDGSLVLTNREGHVITFSQDQSVQKKVTMVALGELSNFPKAKLAQTFGFKTRKSYYDIRDAVINGSAADLAPKRTGPQVPPKRTREVEILIIQKRYETDLNMYEIADALTKLGFQVSPRLVAEVLSDYGLSKKNR